MNNTWPQKFFASMFENEPPPAAPIPELPEVVEQARREWLYAQNYYNSVSDTDLVDYASYLIQAAEKKYMYLMKKARSEGVTFSPYS